MKTLLQLGGSLFLMRHNSRLDFLHGTFLVTWLIMDNRYLYAVEFMMFSQLKDKYLLPLLFFYKQKG